MHALVCVTKTAVQKAIQATLPTGRGQRNRKLFALAVALKQVDGLDTSSASLRAIVRAWHALALPVIGTKDFNESLTDFVIAWKRAKAPISMQAVVAEARRIPTPLAGLRYDEEPMRLLVALCACLQQARPSQPFFLSTRDAAKLLDTNPMDAWRMLQVLLFDSVLEQVKPGRLGRTRSESRAAEFRYIGQEQ